MKIVLMAIALISLIGCSGAERSKTFNMGDTASITCYSGGKVIYDGQSTGKIESEQTSDGYYFRERGSSRLMEVSGNCVIIYED